MKQAKAVGRRIVPKQARDSARAAYWAGKRWHERKPQEIVLRHLTATYGDVVQSGPFAGMRSLTTMDDGCIIPKLLGSYEEEIHQWVEFLVDRCPSKVIDVGCASGWYTTGFAYRLPQAKVLGFDLDDGAISRASELARLNEVDDRVEIRKERLTAKSLGDLVEPSGCLVFMDIDGPEIDVLNPEDAPRLLDADVLVEFHDHFNPAISTTIVDRFAATHQILRTFASGRDPAHYRQLDPFHTRWVRDAAVAERRPNRPRQEFALMLRKGI